MMWPARVALTKLRQRRDLDCRLLEDEPWGGAAVAVLDLSRPVLPDAAGRWPCAVLRITPTGEVECVGEGSEAVAA